MSDNIKNGNSKLFINLSEKEQESLSSGYGMFYMFYQNTNILTSASNIMNISQGDFSGYSNSQTQYKLSQTTFILASLFGESGGSRRNRRRRGSSLLGKIFSFL
ncbi:MAG: hypothetical protein ACLBM6_11245 [Cuspidothrix sp.]|jgi:hypothetical protein